MQRYLKQNKKTKQKIKTGNVIQQDSFSRAALGPVADEFMTHLFPSRQPEARRPSRRFLVSHQSVPITRLNPDEIFPDIMSQLLSPASCVSSPEMAGWGCQNFSTCGSRPLGYGSGKADKGNLWH